MIDGQSIRERRHTGTRDVAAGEQPQGAALGAEDRRDKPFHAAVLAERARRAVELPQIAAVEQHVGQLLQRVARGRQRNGVQWP